MVDPYLQELLQGNKTREKSRFARQLDKDIDEELLDPDIHSELEADSIKILRLKITMKKELELPEISSRIKMALDLLYDNHELASSEKENILNDFVQARAIINQLKEKNDLTANLKTLFRFSDASIESIFKLAIKKLETDDLESSLALFILLVVLVPENPDYSYRAGLIAQMGEHIEFARQLYTVCLKSNPKMIEAKVLLLDCCVKLGDQEKASAIYSELIVDLQNVSISEPLEDLFLKLKDVL